jgi:hypothetical protein
MAEHIQHYLKNVCVYVYIYIYIYRHLLSPLSNTNFQIDSMVEKEMI